MKRFEPFYRFLFFAATLLAVVGYLLGGLSPGDASRPGNAPPLAAEFATTDREWSAHLASRGIAHADPADWLTVCRRVSLAMVGSGVSLEEIRELESLPVGERVATHLENLLTDDRFHHYFSERFTRAYVGADEGPFLVYRRRRFRIWLAEQFAAGRPYDQIVRDLVTAEGLWTNRPEVNFVTVTLDSNEEGKADPIRLASRTARAFLGLRIDCLQCHDDFLGNVSLGGVDNIRGGTQQDFHQLAAFYSSTNVNGLKGVQSGDVDYRYKYLHDDQESDVPARVPFAEDLLPDESDEPDVRARLATWLTHRDNRQFARAAVHRVWALMVGRPVNESVDDLPLDSDDHPVIARLVDDFIANEFDLRRLIRGIVASPAFRIDSRADFDITAEHENEMAVFPLSRLRPEQVAGAMIQASRAKRIDRDSAFFVQLQKFGSTNDFVTRYGDIGEDEFTGDSVTITQRLMMMNGQLTGELIDPNPIMNLPKQASMFAKDDAATVETIYLATLNRRPTDKECEHFLRRLSESEDRDAAVADLTWVLLNSSELAWNH